VKRYSHPYRSENRHYGLLGALRLLADDFSQDGIEVKVEVMEMN
jgi:hypothetical protein